MATREQKLALIQRMNERGVLIYHDALVVTCAKTGEILGYEYYDDPYEAVAELNEQTGGVQFFTMELDTPHDKRKLN